MMPYIATFCAGLLWTIATQIFSHQGRRISVFRLNFYKGVLAFFLFSGVAFFIINRNAVFETLFFYRRDILFTLCLSGFMGFAIADLFSFRAFAIMGAARCLMILSFAPIFVALYSYLLLGTVLTPRKMLGLIVLMLCILCLSFDKKQKLPFSWHAVMLCFIAMLLDSFGVVLSKYSFTQLPELHSAQANVIRVGVSIPTLLLINLVNKKKLGISDIPKKQVGLIVLGTFLGTFLALLCYLYAISQSEAAVIVALGGLTPIYSSIYEHVRDKIFPSLSFFMSVCLMILGIFLLV